VIGRPIRRMTNRTLGGFTCVGLLAGLLTAGLWPFHSPRNEVAWSGHRHGIRFGRHGIISSSEGFAMPRLPDKAFYSVVTITSDTHSTTVYLDGAPIEHSLTSSFRMRTSRAVLSPAPRRSGVMLGPASWVGWRFTIGNSRGRTHFDTIEPG
jgi:hypothetical protein